MRREYSLLGHCSSVPLLHTLSPSMSGVTLSPSSRSHQRFTYALRHLYRYWHYSPPYVVELLSGMSRMVWRLSHSFIRCLPASHVRSGSSPSLRARDEAEVDEQSWHIAAPHSFTRVTTIRCRLSLHLSFPFLPVCVSFFPSLNSPQRESLREDSQRASTGPSGTGRY